MKKILALLLATMMVTLSIPASFAAETEYTKLDMEKLNKIFYDVFPDGEKVKEKSVALNDFVLSPDKEYKVKITFVNTNAGLNNSLGYFTLSDDVKTAVGDYYTDVKPANIKESKLILEKVKDIEKGKSIEIGPFKAGEKIGFYNQSEVGTFYSVKSLNTDGISHTGKYKDRINEKNYVPLGFEDLPVSKSDLDYNDLFFAIQVSMDNQDGTYEFPNIGGIDDIKIGADGWAGGHSKLSGGGSNFSDDGNGTITIGISGIIGTSSEETTTDGTDNSSAGSVVGAVTAGSSSSGSEGQGDASSSDASNSEGTVGSSVVADASGSDSIDGSASAAEGFGASVFGSLMASPKLVAVLIMMLTYMLLMLLMNLLKAMTGMKNKLK